MFEAILFGVQVAIIGLMAAAVIVHAALRATGRQGLVVRVTNEAYGRELRLNRRWLARR